MARNVVDVRQYPESDKLAAASKERSAISDFLEWLHGEGIWLCKSDGRFYPITATDETVIMKFLEIDPIKLEQERRDMLGALRADS